MNNGELIRHMGAGTESHRIAKAIHNGTCAYYFDPSSRHHPAIRYEHIVMAQDVSETNQAHVQMLGTTTNVDV